MNTENVISLEAAIDEVLPFKNLTMTSDGVNYAGAGDRIIGTSLPNDLNRNQASVQVFGHYADAELGNDTAVVRGDELEQAADGRLVKKTTGNACAVACEPATATGDGFHVIFFASVAPANPST